MANSNLIWAVLGLPIFGFLLQCFFAYKKVDAKSRKLVSFLAVAPIAVAFALGVMLTINLAGQDPSQRAVVETLFSWIKIQTLNVPFEVRIDPLSMTMVLIITGIGSLIHLYATGYMSEEKEFSRFFSYLNLFIAFMLVLVLGNNLALLFIGWEGVGLCSYLLIGFWYKDLANSRAANKAFIVNRIGDWGMTLGLFVIVGIIAGSLGRIGDVDGRYLSYDVILSPEVLKIFAETPVWTTVACLLLFVGAMGKSAQFPLYIWLPDAMAGPTPVSALIHAATMVTSGIVLLNRMSPMFEMSPTAGAVITVIGAITALMGALIAFGQTDIKKVLAYSTVSQLGFMFVACGVGAYWVGMFHVITHAFFKALLFLGSGAVIHAMSHDQDMRHYGNLWKYIKITWITMLCGWVAIAGVYGTSGFWSKEAILGNALGNTFAVVGGVNVGYFVGILLLFVAMLTAAYMTRMTMLTFFGGKEQWRALVPHSDHGHGHDEHAHGEHHAHDHGPDTHGFFYTDEEMAAKHASAEHDHHHELESTHSPHEVPSSMWVPLAVLAVLSLAGGWVLHSNHLLQHWLYPNGTTFLPKEMVSGHPHHGIFAGSGLLIASIVAATVGMLYGVIVYRKGLPAKEGDESTWNPLRRWAGNQFGFDKAMVDAAVDGGGAIGEFAWKTVDQKGVDGIVHGSAKLVGAFAFLLRKLQTGFVRGYAAMMLFGTVGILGYIAYVLINQGGVK
jgi:NADH-quinone oxidoreductase subunit L